MDNLFEMLQQQLTPEVVSSLSKRLKADEQTTRKAAEGGIASIVQALARNASNQQGAASLNNALDRDHDGGLLSDVLGMFSGRSQPQNSRAANGLGILEHVLGKNSDNILQMISKGSGLNLLKSGSLLSMLAPLVMGSLGKAKRSQGLDAGGIMNLLSNSIQREAPKHQEFNIINKILDADGDGNVMDEVAGMGMKLLGGLFRK